MTVRIIDIFELSRTKRVVEGELALFDFAHLPESLAGEGKKANVRYRASGCTGARGLPAVQLTLAAELVTECVHCGKPCAIKIEETVPFLLTRTEAEADAIPLEEDGDFEVVPGSDRFDLVRWIEEELILSLPAFPRHDDCVVDERRFSSEETEETERTNKPFANLASLIKH